MKSARQRIDPLLAFGHDLLGVEKPARYIGGEYGSATPKGDSVHLDFALCFPDLYEIGMSNSAMRILYKGLNAIPGVRCERVFAPAPDFEALLQERDIPLYTLESGIPLHEVDFLGFSVGYELAATSLLTVLHSGRIPLLRSERGEEDPLVIAGGPAISNPQPLALFLDAVWIGEAEAGFFDLMRMMTEKASSGSLSRNEKLALLADHPSIWIPGQSGEGRRTRRAIFRDFAQSTGDTAWPVPVLKTVQAHGSVEIMRGCPNGCRFCHAGYYYRPQRIKSAVSIHAEVENLVRRGGFREITLASLSSGDYPGILPLVESLNKRWAPHGVSFQLPSLKIDTFTLPLLEGISEVRKSGLTFAIETPVEAWQASINKSVSFERTVGILQEAARSGFRQAKFYFMIGLPVEGFGLGEARAIVDFMSRIARASPVAITLSVGTFVPKPHTPYERCPQLGEDAALEAISFIRAELRPFRRIKVTWHAPFSAILEGLISRGSEDVGVLVLEAWKRGARLDAWDEHLDRELWRSVLAEAPSDLVERILGGRGAGEALPWSGISIAVTKSYMVEEIRRSKASEFTSSCTDECTNFCGSCAPEHGIVYNSIQNQIESIPELPPPLPRSTIRRQVVLRFAKRGKAAFHAHLAVVDAFSRAFFMAELPVLHTEGFNPLPKMETMPPLGLAAESESEILQFFLEGDRYAGPDAITLVDEAIRALAARLPEGIVIVEGRAGLVVRTGEKQPESIGSRYRASRYRVSPIMPGGESADTRLEAIADLLHERGATHILQDTGSVEFTIRDASGGASNPQRILESFTELRPVLRAFHMVRLMCYAENTDGDLEDLYKVL